MTTTAKRTVSGEPSVAATQRSRGRPRKRGKKSHVQGNDEGPRESRREVMNRVDDLGDQEVVSDDQDVVIDNDQNSLVSFRAWPVLYSLGRYTDTWRKFMSVKHGGEPIPATSKIRPNPILPQGEQASTGFFASIKKSLRKSLTWETETSGVSAVDVAREKPNQSEEEEASRQTAALQLADTLESLEPGTWVSSTAILDACRCLRSGDDHIFDPLEFNKNSVQKYTRRQNDDSPIERHFIPAHSSTREHWYLGVISKQSSSISVYDSLASHNPRSIDSELLTTLASKIFPERKECVVQMVNCPQQPNGHDCGVFVIATICFLMAKFRLPERYDGEVWRSTCRWLQKVLERILSPETGLIFRIIL